MLQSEFRYDSEEDSSIENGTTQQNLVKLFFPLGPSSMAKIVAT